VLCFSDLPLVLTMWVLAAADPSLDDMMVSAFQVNATGMMAQTMQGKVMPSYAPSSFSIRQQMSPGDFEMLQPDNMDQSTSPIRGIIIQKM